MQHVFEAACGSLGQSLEAPVAASAIIRNALNVAGPGLFTIALAECMQQTGQEVLCAAVPQAYRIVMNGPELLGQPLEYKKTARHWLVAGNDPQDATGA